ncbi:hypothetical protein [Acrocarpospora macrocephala]|uniref:hypothetical protein n=1 Tax=Acrocarpospora macrocephala TaxID=150177 RepID=UPI0012D34443|nr:hypothetical protein [Acrocarpospora macrocephala]
MAGDDSAGLIPSLLGLSEALGICGAGFFDTIGVFGSWTGSFFDGVVFSTGCRDGFRVSSGSSSDDVVVLSSGFRSIGAYRIGNSTGPSGVCRSIMRAGLTLRSRRTS